MMWYQYPVVSESRSMKAVFFRAWQMIRAPERAKPYLLGRSTIPGNRYFDYLPRVVELAYHPERFALRPRAVVYEFPEIDETWDRIVHAEAQAMRWATVTEFMLRYPDEALGAAALLDVDMGALAGAAYPALRQMLTALARDEEFAAWIRWRWKKRAYLLTYR